MVVIGDVMIVRRIFKPRISSYCFETHPVEMVCTLHQFDTHFMEVTCTILILIPWRWHVLCIILISIP